MDRKRHERIAELFEATSKLPASECEAYLRAACADDPTLIEEVLSLLAHAGDEAALQPLGIGKALHEVAVDVARSFEPEMPEKIGPYRIVRLIGEGGCGVVYLAEQSDPRRQVAIKVIKPGMDSKAVLARFEQERQALAVMDHPNVAKVYDAGTTPPEMGSRPYFVMEYVAGESITDYCDTNHLNIGQRLELFIPVCEAVQHAHHKGIIHRDLKPSNVLVSVNEGVPTAKVIDFGVAKAINQTLTEKTIFTEHGQIIGTPAYMSPEQAQTGSMDIDARTDVYSLGVVLYEMLTGLLPFDSAMLRSKVYGEIQRIIREEEPPRPSTRLTSSGAQGAAIAQQRQTEIGSLTKQLRDELEWIPLKAMRKDRTERYRTPLELADDIRNYLDGNPLSAGPESRSYRLRKFVRRNQAGVIGTSALAIVLIAAVIVSTSALIVWNRTLYERNAALIEAKDQRIENLVQKAILAGQRGDWKTSLLNYDEAIRRGIAENVQIRLARVQALIATGRRSEAQKLMSTAGDCTDALTHRHQLLLWKGDVALFGAPSKHGPDPLALIAQAIAPGEPGTGEIELSIAELEYGRGLLAKTATEAADHFAQALRLDPYHYGANALLVPTLLLQGHKEEGTHRLRVARLIYPDDPSLKTCDAFLMALDGRSEALSMVDDLKKNFRASDAATLRGLIEIILELNKKPGAAHDPQTSSARLSLLAFQKFPGVVTGGQSVDLGIMLPPALREVIADLGPALRKKVFGDNDGAAALLKRITDVNPEAALYILYGEALWDGHHELEAEKAFMKASELPSIIDGAVMNALVGAMTTEFDMLFVKHEVSDPEMQARCLSNIVQVVRAGAVARDFAFSITKSLIVVGQFDVARTLLWDLESQAEDKSPIASIRFELEYASGAYGPAIAACDVVLDKDPANDRAKVVRSKSVERLGRIGTADAAMSLDEYENKRSTKNP